FESSLPPVPNNVDLGVIRDRFQGNVRYPFVDETLPNIPVRRLKTRCSAGSLGLFEFAFTRIGEQIVGVAHAHDSSARKRERDPRGVDCDPPAPPLLSNRRRGTRATCRVEY